jgi:hypothetical protein
MSSTITNQNTLEVITMTDRYFVLDTKSNNVVHHQGLPWLTDDYALVQFTAWSYNKQGGDPRRYKTMKFVPAIAPDPTTRLAIPYLPQWGPTADERRGDCGPANIAMITPYMVDASPTVDAAADACGQPTSGAGSGYTNHAQLRNGARFYGWKLETRSPYVRPVLDLDLLKTQVDKDLPSIALIHYGVLRDLTNPDPNLIHNQDQAYSRGHWVVFTGYDQKGVYIHDPDFGIRGERADDGKYRLVPDATFDAALKTVAPGCSVGYQGLIVTGEPK